MTDAETWKTFIDDIGELSEDSQPNASVERFQKTQRGKINAVIRQGANEYNFNMISANSKKKTVSLRCSHVRSGCSAKAKRKVTY